MPEPGRERLVSVVIPVYNGANYLVQAIDSALAQTWSEVEVIVVDDGSDDDGATAAIASRYGDRIRYLHKPNGGVATAVNRGIEAMRGRYFSWLSHDDVYAPDKIERQMKVMLGLPGPAVVFSDYSLVDARGEEPSSEIHVGQGYDQNQPLWAVLEGRLNGCAMLVDRQCFDRVGLFDPRLPTTQDYDLWYRIALSFPFVYAPGLAVRHRRHEGQGSRDPRHHDEVALLLTCILDHLSESTIAAHAPCPMAFWMRLARSPLVAGSAGASAAVDSRLREETARVPMSAVITGGKTSIGTSIDEIERARAAGLAIIHAVGHRPLNARWHRIAFLDAGDDGPELWLLSYSPESGPGPLLDRAAIEAAELVWCSSAPGPDVLDQGLADPVHTLIAHPEAVACLQDQGPIRYDRNELGALDGSVIRRGPLKQALQESTGTVTSLLHALSRLGPIVTCPGRRVQWTRKQPSAAHRPRVPFPIRRSVRIARWFDERPRLQRRVVPLIWRLAGGQRGGGKRLAHWWGLDSLLDVRWYLATYPDVADSGMDPVVHFLCAGHRESRDPSADFNTARYRQEHPDVARAGMNPLQHYAVWGRRERRTVHPSARGREPLVDAIADGRPALLIVLHSIGGGVARFASDLAAYAAPKLRGIFLCGLGGGRMMLGTHERGRFGREFTYPASTESMRRALARLDVRRILVLHNLGFDGNLDRILAAVGVPFDVLALDYALVANQPHLVGRDNRYVGDCQLGAPAWPYDRERYWLITSAGRILACSRDLAQRLARLGIKRPITVIAPPDPQRLSRFRPWARRAREGDSVHVALLGIIAPHKGRNVFIEVLERVTARGLPIRFTVFGQVVPPLPLEFAGLVRIEEAATPSALTTAICGSQPHMAWFPFQAPETHSYALTDAIANGLPVVAADIGAVSERLQGRPLTTLVPWSAEADVWVSEFLRLHGAMVAVECETAGGHREEETEENLRKYVRSVAGRYPVARLGRSDLPNDH